MSDREDSTRPAPGAGGTVVGIHGDQPRLDLQGGGKTPLDRWAWLNSVQNSIHGPNARAAVITLSAILQRAGQERGCTASIATLADDVGCTPRTIKRGIAKLKEVGILPPRRRGKEARYEVDLTWQPGRSSDTPCHLAGHTGHTGTRSAQVTPPVTLKGDTPCHPNRNKQEGAGSAVAVPCTATAEAEPAPSPIGDSESGAARAPVTRGSGPGHARGPHEPAEREKQKPADSEPAEPTADQLAAMLADWSDHDLLRFREGARGAADRERELASYDAELARRGLQDQAEAIAARADAERAEAATRAETAAAAKADAEAMTDAELEGALQSSQAVLSDLGAEAESWTDSDAWEAGARRIRAEQVRHEALSEALRRRLEHQRGKPVDRAEAMAAVQALNPGSLPRLSADIVPLDRKEPPPPAAEPVKPVQLTLDLDLPDPDAESDSEAAS